MGQDGARDLAARLGRVAETVCRHYLPSGRRVGRYWVVGDARGSPGRSMFVRLAGAERGPGAAGKWTDAATGEHGDLLDIIREALGLSDFSAVAEEARRFLGHPVPAPVDSYNGHRVSRDEASAEGARRLIALSQPITGTLAETYLLRRGITALGEGRRQQVVRIVRTDGKAPARKPRSSGAYHADADPRRAR